MSDRSGGVSEAGGSRPHPVGLRILLAIGLALAVGTTSFIVLTRSDEPQTALAVVQQGKRDYAAAPALHGTILVDHAYERGGQSQRSTVEVWHAGRPGTLTDSTRMQLLETDALGSGGFSEAGPGSFVTTVGEETREYTALYPLFSVRQTVRQPGGERPFYGWPRNTVFDYERVCRDLESKLYADEDVAGRRARHIACGDLSGALTRAGFNSPDAPGTVPTYHLWVDVKTGVLLKVAGQADGPFYIGSQGSWEFKRIQYGMRIDSQVFRPAAPAGVRDPSAEREAGVAALRSAGSFRAEIEEVIEPPTCPSEEFRLGPEGCKGLSRVAFRYRVSYRDETAARVEVASRSKAFDTLVESPILDGAPGSFATFDAGACRFYQGLERLSRAAGVTPGEAPARSASSCAWLDATLARLVPGLRDSWEMPGDKLLGWETFSAAECRATGTEQVAGRPARRLACPTRDAIVQQTFWLDDATGLVLKHVVPGRIKTEVTRLEQSPSFDPNAFVFATPPGARDLQKASTDPYLWTQLGKGGVAPTWRAPVLNGGSTVDLANLHNRPTLILVSGCTVGWEACDLLPPLQRAAEKWREKIDVVWIADTSFDAPNAAAAQKLVQTIVARNGYTFLVLLDRFGGLGPGDAPADPVGAAWKIHPPILNEFPASIESSALYVLLDTEGRVVDAKLGRQSSADLDRLIQKLAGSSKATSTEP